MPEFRSLTVWARAHRLTLDVYQSTAAFPREELYGLCSQIRRSAASIPTNIAEGCGRAGRLELARFFQLAMGSACELEYQLLLAHDLRMLDRRTYPQHMQDLKQIKRMLASYVQKIRAQHCVTSRPLTSDFRFLISDR
jgi:four helix bundle protein